MAEVKQCCSFTYIDCNSQNLSANPDRQMLHFRSMEVDSTLARPFPPEAFPQRCVIVIIHGCGCVVQEAKIAINTKELTICYDNTTYCFWF